jgi:UPF0716 protein FxsA
MGPLLFVLLLIVPIAELWVIVQIADQIGFLFTLVLLLAVSIAGAWLLKQQGMETWRSLQGTLRRGEMPTQQVTDGALILLGGALLMTPGFLTDAVGLFLLVPATRTIVKGMARGLMGRWAAHRFGGSRSPVRRARVVRVERQTPRDGSSPVPPAELGSPAPRRDGADSRDTT